MASASQPSAYDGDRDAALNTPRRQLLTRRGSQDTPPRVVLHLPDLEALSAVAIGPPQPSTRRRIDASHATSTVAASSPSTPTAENPSLLKLLKIPVAKFLRNQSSGEAVSVGKLLVLLQQPKMLLAAILAIGLQLAAVLAMLTGGSQTKNGEVVTKEPTATWPLNSPPAGYGTVQTPASLSNLAPATAANTPSLPPPQTLPGLDSRDLPPWPGDANSGVGAMPQLSGPPPVANQPAKLSAPPAAMPTLAPPRPNESTAEDKTAAGSPTMELPMPTMPSLGGPTQAIPATQSNESGSGRPKARLQGTIKKTSAVGVAK